MRVVSPLRYLRYKSTYWAKEGFLAGIGGSALQGIFDAVRRGQYDITNKPWDKISRQAKDLVQKLLVINPKQRLTAQQALQHPWLREGGEAPDTVLDDTVLSRLKKFSGMNRLKKMALNVIAKNMSQHEIEGLSEMFKAFDRDNSGTITMQELKEGLKKMVRRNSGSF